MNRRNRKSRRQVRDGRLSAHGAWALTLVEVLVTLVLSTMMVTAAATVVVQSARARAAAETTVARRWSWWGLLHRFREDIEGRVRGPEETPAIRLLSGPDELLEVVTLTRAPDSEGFLARRLPARITYLRKRNAGSGNTQSLIRRAAPLVEGELATAEATLAEGLYELAIEEFREGGWTSTPRAHDGKRVHPPAGIRLVFREDSDSPREVCTVPLLDTAAVGQRTAGPSP